MNRVAALSVGILTLGGCTFLDPTTPDGLNVEPLISLAPIGTFEQFEKINDSLPFKAHEYGSQYGQRTIALDNKQFRVHRRIAFELLGTATAASERYEELKRPGLRRHKLFEEEGADRNKYFSSYSPPELRKWHGIPIGLSFAPDVLLVHVKENLLVLIQYISLPDAGVNHISAMNEDIAYAADLLRKAAAQQGIPVDRPRPASSADTRHGCEIDSGYRWCPATVSCQLPRDCEAARPADSAGGPSSWEALHKNSIGYPLSEIAEHWGEPVKVTPTPSGGHEHEYRLQKIDASCVHWWQVDKAGVITGFRYEGACKVRT